MKINTVSNIKFGEVEESGPSLKERKQAQRAYNKYLENIKAEDIRWNEASSWRRLIISLKNIFKK